MSSAAASNEPQGAKTVRHDDDLPRLCREVREIMADSAGLAPTGMTKRVADAHLKHCPECAKELSKQSVVKEGLSALKGESEMPPEGLLEDVLAATEEEQGLRTWIAGPARGAVSGARPQLTAAVIVGGALAGTGIGWATVSGVRKIRAKRRRPIS